MTKKITAYSKITDNITTTSTTRMNIIVITHYHYRKIITIRRTIIAVVLNAGNMYRALWLAVFYSLTTTATYRGIALLSKTLPGGSAPNFTHLSYTNNSLVSSFLRSLFTKPRAILSFFYTIVVQMFIHICG